MKQIFLTLSLLLLANIPLQAMPGMVIASPHAFLYREPFGIELQKIPYGEKIEIIEMERLYSRIQWQNTTAYIPNSHIMRQDYFQEQATRNKDIQSKFSIMRVSEGREIPFYQNGIVTRYIAPGWFLPMETETLFGYKIRFLDVYGDVFHSDVERVISSTQLPISLPTVQKKHHNIAFRFGKSDKPLVAFFEGLLDFFSLPWPDEKTKSRFSYMDEQLSFRDMADLLRLLKLQVDIVLPPANIDHLFSEVEKGYIIIIKIRINGNFRFCLLRGKNNDVVTLLNIREQRGIQLSWTDFLLHFQTIPQFLVISPSARENLQE